MRELALQRAKTFVREVVQPSLADWEATATYPREAVRNSGLTGLFVSRDVGGLGLSFLEAAEVFEDFQSAEPRRG